MDAINWHSCFFWLFAAIACAFAVAVVVTGNIVRMACYLVVALAAVAGLFFMAGADFLGAVQLMVYVGGTMVLLVFGVMLTARGPFVTMKTGGGQWILATILGGALLAVLLQAALSIPGWATAGGGPDDRPTATRLGLGLMGMRVDQLDQPDPMLRRGMSGHLLAFEIISVHLVVVLIGAAYLARARRRVQGSGLRVQDSEAERRQMPNPVLRAASAEPRPVDPDLWPLNPKP
jgi:NADH-quinone oxidoreductase subunit J